VAKVEFHTLQLDGDSVSAAAASSGDEQLAGGVAL